MKTFLAVWEFIRQFKSIINIGIWMLIPGINLIRAACYAGEKMNDIGDDYSRSMNENFLNSVDPFDDTKKYWIQLVTQFPLSLGYAALGLFVNLFVYHKLLDKFGPISPDAPPIMGMGDTIIPYASYTVMAIICIVAVTSAFKCLNAIYNTHTTMHPDYAKVLDPYFIRTRDARTKSRQEAA